MYADEEWKIFIIEYVLGSVALLQPIAIYRKAYW